MSAVQATAAASIPPTVSVSDATGSLPMPHDLAYAALAPLPTRSKRSMPYTPITSKFMKAIREKRAFVDTSLGKASLQTRGMKT